MTTLGGSSVSPRKIQTALAKARKLAKLTEKDVADIRKSSASNKELAKKIKSSMGQYFELEITRVEEIFHENEHQNFSVSMS